MKKLNNIAWLHENNFYLTSDKSRILKLVDHYEVFKMIKNVKGDIFEFGVFKGASLIRFLTFRDLIENSSKRKIVGFDAFGKFPKPKSNKINKIQDGIFATKHDKKIGLGIKEDLLRKVLLKKNFSNFELYKGNVLDTLPNYLKKNSKLKIALLHLDLDTYEPTDFVLNFLYKKISKNGIILLDDYKHIKGATLAVNKFLKEMKLKIIKVSKNGRPYYIKK